MEDFSPPAERHPVLYGPDGLRAGWSILLYLSVLVTLLVLGRLEVGWVAMRLHQAMPGARGGRFHPTLAVLSESASLLAVLLATALMAFLERGRVAAYGLAGPGRVKRFFQGLASGFVLLSLLVGILVATHHLRLAWAHRSTGQMLAYAAAWGLCFLLVGMTEELMLRGYLLFTLARGIGFWPAAIVLGAAFGLLHRGNAGESRFGLVAVALVALVFSLSLWRLGHLWWAIGFHAAWDWAESFFYGTADSGLVSAGRLMRAHPSGPVLLSGGATGPEGSVWAALSLVLAVIFILVTQPRVPWNIPERNATGTATPEVGEHPTV